MDESESLRHSKCAVSHVVGDIQGKSAIHLARVYGEPKKNFVGQGCWVRGDFVPTVGRDETLSGRTSETRSRRTSDWIN